MTNVAPQQRWTRNRPCVICGGYDNSQRGQGVRCYGYLSADGTYARCTREEHAGSLEPEADSNSYPHRLDGPCKCGKEHGGASPARQEEPSGPPEAVYVYVGQDGKPRHRTLRYPGKRFKQQHYRNGDWHWGLGDGGRVLYHLPNILAADNREIIWLVEGERDADRLTGLGLVATTNAMGAKHWQEEYAQSLANRHVMILGDNDRDGRVGAQKKEESLRRLAASVRVHIFSELPEGGDVSDWLDRGHTKDDLLELVSGAIDRSFNPIPLPLFMMKVFPEPKYIIPDVMPEGTTILGGKAKKGKAQPLDALVLTPAGWVAMGELRVGDLVIGSAGCPTPVIAVHPQGTQTVYRLQFNDGTSVEATGDHLWQTEDRNRSSGYGSKVRSTDEIAELLRQGKERSCYVPTVAPVTFEPGKELPLNPYLLGLLLGDGGMTGKGVVLTTIDDEVVEFAAAAAPASDIVARTRNMSVGIRHRAWPHRAGQSGSDTMAALRALHLYGLRSEAKFVPLCYKRASVPDRLALLQGLMDTDGSMEGRVPVFNTSSHALALDVQEIIETLGGTASISMRTPVYHHKGERREGLPAYRVRVRLPRALGCPFRLTRKVTRWAATRPTKLTVPTRRVVRVERTREAPCQCITVEASDGLYVTEHCIVTHNSWWALATGLASALGGVALGSIPVDRTGVLYLVLEDADDAFQERVRILLGTDTVPENFHVEFWSPAMDEIGIEVLREWLIGRTDIGFVIVDTLERVRPEDNGRGNAYRQDYRAVRYLADLSHRLHISVLILHHLTKEPREEDPFDELSGTSGLQAAADTLMVLRGTRTEDDAVLHVRGRRLKQDHALALKFSRDYAMWFVAGEAGEVADQKMSDRVLVCLSDMGPMQPKEIAEVLDLPSTGAVRQALFRMKKAGIVDQTGGGKYMALPQHPGPLKSCNAVTEPRFSPSGRQISAVTGGVTACNAVTGEEPGPGGDRYAVTGGNGDETPPFPQQDAKTDQPLQRYKVSEEELF